MTETSSDNTEGKNQPTQEDRKKEALQSEEIDRMKHEIKNLSVRMKTFTTDIQSGVSEKINVF